jgi:hypothetical protein
MSQAQVYITTGIHNVMGSPITDIPFTPGARTPAVIRGQITQFRNLKIAIPRKNYRTADLTVNLMSPEIEQFYTSSDPDFSTYSNFLYIKWRGHLVFWGPILTKEVDYEGRTLTLHAKDQGSRLEKNFFKIGDEAMDGKNPGGNGLQWPFASTGHLPVNSDGIRMCLQSAAHMEDTRIMTDDNLRYPAFIPLGVRMGFNHHTDSGRKITIQRADEIWSKITELGDRIDGPLVDFVPLDISDGKDFAVCNVYGPYFRNDLSSTIKFHYNTGLNNVRNIQPAYGGEVLSHVNSVSQDGRWNVYSIYMNGGNKYGIWVQWEAMGYNLPVTSSKTDARDSLGAHGDAVLDAYGEPLIAVTVTLRRDDQVRADDSSGSVDNQFHFIDDFHVGDAVEIAGVQGPESFTGNYLIDQVDLQQVGDNTGEILQVITVFPWVQEGERTYRHGYILSRPDNSGSS